MIKKIFLVLIICCAFSAQLYSSLVCYNVDNLEKVRAFIRTNNKYYTSAYDSLLKEADNLLLFDANPVVNKTLTPPSGDKHDYLSIAPYFWPNETTANGIPWIPKDGRVNPTSRGDDTDFSRTNAMFDALDKLSLAFYFTKNKSYLEKAKEIIEVWFVCAKTKINPNTNFGQSVPGGVEGRPLGIIEWSVSSLITPMQLLMKENMCTISFIETVNKWLDDYLHWLLTSKLGKEEDMQPQNHGSWYDYKVVSIQLYLGYKDDAKNRILRVHTKRIAEQLELDGAQPFELRRTKSVYYSEMNLRAMTLMAELGKQVGVNLWTYRTENGRSLDLAYEWLQPYVCLEKEWSWKQITPGGIKAAIETRLMPLFSIGSTLKGEFLYDSDLNFHQNLNYMQRLKYPPLKDLID